jgi:phosphoribosylformimino-5-aminoimidazole carboxamide ribotide isomerase
MRIAGVIDLLGGHAVHARAGDRQRYAPVASVAGDAAALARQYMNAGVTDLYVADLNAILSRTRQDALIRSIADVGVPLWLDAGTSSVETARECLALGVSRVIVGLETLTTFQALRAICDAVGGNQVAFSLDLRDAQPLGTMTIAATPNTRGVTAMRQSDLHVSALARQAADAGAGAIIVLDLARVGSRSGLDLELVKLIRELLPDVMVLAGGGIRDAADLTRLSGIGCDGALVATALHDGRLSAADIARFTTE